MIGCLISLIIVAIIALIVVLVIEAVMAEFIPNASKIFRLIRLAVGLLVLLWVVECLLGTGILGEHLIWRP